MKNFSSLENKRLKNLQTISGGSASSRNSPSQYTTSDGQVNDTDFYKDDTAGVWTYSSRTSVMVGPAKPTEGF